MHTHVVFFYGISGLVSTMQRLPWRPWVCPGRMGVEAAQLCGSRGPGSTSCAGERVPIAQGCCLYGFLQPLAALSRRVKGRGGQGRSHHRNPGSSGREPWLCSRPLSSLCRLVCRRPPTGASICWFRSAQTHPRAGVLPSCLAPQALTGPLSGVSAGRLPRWHWERGLW